MNGQNQTLRRSRRLATIIPGRHWEAMGYESRTARSLEVLQRDMEKFGSERKIDDEGVIEIALNGSHRRVPHHDLLLPHWQKFARGAKERPNLQRIEIYAVHLLPPVLDEIMPAMHRLQALSLLGVDLGRPGLLRLASFLEENTSLKELMVGGDAIVDHDVADSLSDAFGSHPSLERVFLLSCGLGNAAILGRVLEGCKRMKSISFNSNTIGSEGAAILGEFVGSNHRAELLDLNRNPLLDGDAEILASSLNSNNHLRQLDLIRNNSITDAGRTTLLKSVFDTASMSSIVASNHTCRFVTFDKDSDSNPSSMEKKLERYLGDINFSYESEGKKIRMKAVLALRLKGSYGLGCGERTMSPFDLKHFADVPLKAMPLVLEFIQENSEEWEAGERKKESNEKDALSALFHTLRGWQMPSLFTNLRVPLERSRKRKRNVPR